MFFSFKGFIPVVDPSSFVHPQANVTGNVIIGKDVYIGPGAVLRGDWGGIVVEDGCNIQENCVIHMFPGITVRLEKNAHIGHGAIIHGAHIGKNCMVGMNSVIMDNVVLGENTIIGALTFIKAKETIPPNSLVVGNPGKVIKTLEQKMIDWKTKGTNLYQKLPTDMQNEVEEVQPLTSLPENRPSQESLFKTWNEIKYQ